MKRSNDKELLYQNYQRHLVKATVSANTGINNTDRLFKVYGASANRIDVLIRLKKYSKFSLIWFITFFLLGLVCLYLDPSGWFNILDLYIVMVNIYLVANGRLSGIYLGTIECILYAMVCYKSQLFGEIIKVMCISVPLNIVSIVSWTINLKRQNKEKYTKKKDDDIAIKKLTKKQLSIYAIIFIVVSGLCFLLLKYIIGQTNALFFGSIAIATTIVGKILTAQKYLETYPVFIAGTIIGLFMWGQTILQTGFSVAEFTMIIYNIACLTNDIYAYRLWKSMYRRVAVNGGVILAMRQVNIKKIIKLRRRYKNLRWNKKIDMQKNS